MTFRIEFGGSRRTRVKGYGRIDVSVYKLIAIQDGKDFELTESSGSNGSPKWIRIARDTLREVNEQKLAGEMTLSVAKVIVERISARKFMKAPYLTEIMIEECIATAVAEALRS